MHLNSISALCMEHSNSTDSLSLIIAGHLATPPDMDCCIRIGLLHSTDRHVQNLTIPNPGLADP